MAETTTPTVEIRGRSRREADRVYYANTRVYVTDKLAEQDETLKQLTTQEENLGEKRFSTRGEFPDVDKLYDRINRRIATVKREIAQQALLARGLINENVRVRFSRHAGCSCSCSPGVVVHDVIYDENGRPADIWIS